MTQFPLGLDAALMPACTRCLMVPLVLADAWGLQCGKVTTCSEVSSQSGLPLPLSQPDPVPRYWICVRPLSRLFQATSLCTCMICLAGRSFFLCRMSCFRLTTPTWLSRGCCLCSLLPLALYPDENSGGSDSALALIGQRKLCSW